MVKMIIRYMTLLMMITFHQTLEAQAPQKLIDSLMIVLKSSPTDTNGLKILNNISWQYRRLKKLDAATNYANEALALAENLYKNASGNDAVMYVAKMETGRAYYNLGFINGMAGNHPEILKNFGLSLKTWEELGHREGVALSYQFIGNEYTNLHDYPNALKNYNNSLLIFKELKLKARISGIYNNLGMVYDFQGNYTEALKNLLDGLRVAEEVGDKITIGSNRANIGSLYQRMEKFDEALKYTTSALDIFKEIGDKFAEAGMYENIGVIHLNMNNLSESIRYQKKAIELFHAIGKDGYTPSCYYNIAEAFFKEKNYDEALKNIKESENHPNKENVEGIAYYNLLLGKILSAQSAAEKRAPTDEKYREALHYLNKGLEIAKKDGARKEIMSAYNYLSELYKNMNDYKLALENANLRSDMNDSLLNSETIRKLEQLRTQYDVEKAVAEGKMAQEKLLAERNVRHELELAEEKLKMEKGIEIEKLKYAFALASAKSEEEKKRAIQQYESDTKLAAENTRHQQILEREKTRQLVKDAQSNILLEKEKAEKKKKSEFFIAGLFVLALVSLFSISYIRQRNLKRRAVDKAEAGHKMAELELQSLRAQLNPHFMFNSLNAIQDLILKEDNDRSHLYLSRFSKLLRMLLDNANQPFVTVKQEMEFLELYLSLENLRIPDLQFSIEKDHAINTDQRMIPNMMLQPYIENAIWHGLSNKKGDRKLQIRIHENGNATEFEIEDNGVGRKKAAELKSRYRQRHHSKGMELLSKRFNLLSKEYGASIRTSITDLGNNSDVTGTLVKIDVPISISEQARKLINDTNHNN